MTRTARVDVRGMHCTNCATTVTERVDAVDGVVDVDVNYATEAGTVSYDPDRVDLATIYDAIEAAGYDAAEATVTIGVTDMTCATCVDTVEDALREVAGVIEATANYATDEVRVRYNPEDADRRTLAAAIESAGYTPVAAADGDDADADAGANAREGRDAAREADRRRELRRTLFGALLSAPLVALMIDRLLLGGQVPGTVAGVPLGWVEFALATPVVVVLGRPFLASSYTAVVRNRRANMDVLIALGSSTAYLYSLSALAGLLASEGLYFDTAALILVFITLGNYLEARSKGRAGRALERLLEVEADTATVIEDAGDGGGEREVPVEEIEVGDRMRVRPGEQVPTDGVVVDGESAVDESAVTGESVPVGKAPGDEVIGSTIVTDGSLVVEATEVGADTALQRIVRTVEAAQSRQPAIQGLADRISAVFVPAVIVNAALWAAVWYLFPDALSGVVGALPLWGLVAGGPAALSAAEFAVVVFASAVLIACPCALGLATPAATMVGTALGAQNGVLFRGGDVVERADEVDAVVFDKTGTLTTGEMRLTDVVPVDPRADGGRTAVDAAPDPALDGDDLLRLAAGAEVGSEHPLGRAIVDGARDRGLDVPDADGFESVPGKGVRATVAGREVRVGNRAFLTDADVDPAPGDDAARRLAEAGKTAMYVAVDGRVVGVLADADTVKESSAAAVAALRERGLDVHLLTGDTERTARAVAERVGIDPANVRAGVLPGEKADVVDALQADGRRVLMVGDGVNDAPALAAAHVGCAIGSGTDVAIEAADVTLLRDDPFDAVRALRVAEGTMTTIRGNLFWALGYNAAMIPLASLGLLQPALAAAAMALSSVSVLTNSLLFGRYDPDEEYGIRSVLRP